MTKLFAKTKPSPFENTSNATAIQHCSSHTPFSRPRYWSSQSPTLRALKRLIMISISIMLVRSNTILGTKAAVEELSNHRSNSCPVSTRQIQRTNVVFPTISLQPVALIMHGRLPDNMNDEGYPNPCFPAPEFNFSKFRRTSSSVFHETQDQSLERNISDLVVYSNVEDASRRKEETHAVP